MFLWVRLVLTTLEECHSIQDVEDSVRNLPEGLDEALVDLPTLIDIF